MGYWGECPPVHILLKAYLGAGGKAPAPKALDQCSDEELDEFMAAVNG